ncbi:LamG domain-containing protein [Streptacidiphilus sp. PB12-B1b]|uniref:LamG domain-containing protein n=1 Tax=Streptacidiphilus sp. PB12-B1b TaxID=2705012 RepID=UPI0015FCB599|nr:LamG domain-containing protein [Streptacidiphilus sp. PB12-B1b]QMU76874.1 LamG domain-containing protein [Streptacidiphilus sp. PB12-B1b]
MQDRTLTKVYRDKAYVSTTTVRHGGTTVAFAMDNQQRIYYSVLDLESAQDVRGPLDAAYWNADPGLLAFPSEIVDPGSPAPVAMVMPTVKKGSRVETAPEKLFAGESDPFLSSTARLTAAAPIQVVSDGRYILVFRQSIGADDPNAVFQTSGTALSGDPARTDYTMTTGPNPAKIAPVDASLLVDRFVLVGSVLKPVVEVRYQRSRSKFAPAAEGTDTLGTRDMDGKLFYEPTSKLSFVRRVQDGGFAVLLLPTAVDGVSRWQLFVNNTAKGQIDSFSCEQGKDGLFNIAGTQLYTSPDPRFASSVLEREPGIDPNTRLPLVPVPASTDRAGTALRFSAGPPCVLKLVNINMAAGTGACTFEAWVRPTMPSGTIAATYDESRADGFHLGVNASGRLWIGQGSGGWSVTGSQALTMGVYTHVAAVFDQLTVTLFVNGVSVGTGAVPVAVGPSCVDYLGSRSVAGQVVEQFVGDIDEVRLWNRARTAADFADRGRRLVGIEPGLVTYYRFDEGAGGLTANQCDNASPAMLNGPVWVASDAPAGDGPGLSRDVFTFGPSTAVRQAAGPLAATLYFQQEPAPTGYGAAPTQEKRQARVLLACATTGPAPTGGSADRRYVATVDFALTRDGRLAMVPTLVPLAEVGKPAPTQNLDTITAAQNRVTAAQTQLATDQAQADLLQPTLNYIADIARFSFRDQQRALLVRTVPPLRLAADRLGFDQAQLAAAQQALATLTGGMQGGSEVVLAMPKVSTDREGLSVYASLLTFAWTTDAPSLLESSTGDVVLYFRGGNGQFFSAYYAADVSRATRTIAVGTGQLTLLARDSAATLADFALSVADGATADLCQVSVTAGAVTETFPGVPRQATAFAQVLNGVRPPGTVLGTVGSAQGQIIELAAALTQPLAAGAAISVGGLVRTVAAAVSAGANKITVTANGDLSGTVGQQLRTALYDYATATCTTVGAVLDRGSQIVGVNLLNPSAPVPNGAAADGAGPLVPRWHGNSPGRALSFDGKAQYLTLPQAGWPKVTSPADLTVEAWVNPSMTSSRSRIWHAAVPGAPYTLALEPGAPTSAFALDGSSWVDCGSGIALAGQSFTIEVWARRLNGGRQDTLFGHGGLTMTDPNLYLGFNQANQMLFGWSGDDLATPSLAVDLGWHCWSASFDVSTGIRTLYCDGIQVAQGQANAPYSGAGRTMLGVAGWGGGWAADAIVDEYRLWGRVRTPDEIAAFVNRQLSGQEPGLLGYWSFPGASTVDRSGNGHDGIMVGKPILTQTAQRGFSLAAGVGTQFFRSQEAFPAGDWSHVAMAFRQDWAMAMDGDGYLDAGGPDGLDLVDDLTLEAFVRLDTLGTVHGLIGKGAIGSGTAASAVPYSFYVESDGQLAFTFESGAGGRGQQQVFRSGSVVKAGVFTKVAVTRKSGEDKSGTVGIRFYINGQVVGGDPQTYGGPKPVGNDANCEIGRYRISTSALGLRGTLAEARIWNVARDKGQIGAPVTAKSQGLVAWWGFHESAGATTADGCDSYPAQVRGPLRVRTPDPAGNSLTFYHSGNPSIAVLDTVIDDLTVMGPNQVTAAARTDAYGQPTEVLTGALDELRVWRTCRTQEQLLDNMFTRLRGERGDLMAYYPFDNASTVPGATVTDAGLQGCDLTPSATAPGIVLSTAPISDDTAEVRSALTGTLTPFSALVTGTPSASEYADLQRDAHGKTIGVMKRSYTSLRGTSWVLTTGFKVGDLTTTWVGQAQFNPQLVGYLEGAPPVPSENLIAGTADDYSGASTVGFVQANTVANTISSDSKTSVDASAKATFEGSVGDDTFVVAAPLGAGTAKPLSSLKASAGGTVEMKYSNSWSNDTQVSQGATTTRTSSVTLAGHWEPTDPTAQLNPTAGRRWAPANTGFAIVQSDTADQYALRLAHSGVLVAYRMVPNPDIPRDWNVIAFPINPRYTKQGTLDGLVGYSAQGTAATLQPFADPSFPNAGDGGAYSYYRPREAYAIKRRIQREEQQLQGFYESVSTDTHAPDPVAAAADRVLKGMMGGTGSSTGLTSGGSDPAAGRAANKSAARRNIVNTYVWTAAGGLFAETTATTDQVTQSTAGDYSVSGSATFQTGFEVEIGPVGFKAGFEATLGGGYSVTRRKTKDATRTFSLDVVAQPGHNLQKYNGTDPVFDANNQPVLVPGRVDAYRFMSFYLDTSSDNYEDFYGKVIDPQWIETSNDPNAKELAKARQSDRKPPCWRILHRVTFVSRVQDTTSTTASLGSALGALGITSDYQLMKQLEPHMVGATSNLADLTTAAKTLITTQFTTLTPYTDTITTRLAAYYNIPTPAPTPTLTPAPTPAPAPAPAPAGTLTASASTLAHGATITFQYATAPATASTKNWIGIYPTGVTPGTGESLTYQYAPTTSGSLTFTTTAGSLANPGNYAAWYLLNDAYTVLAGPTPFTVT